MQVTENSTLQEVIQAIGWEDQAYMVDPMAKLEIDFGALGKATFAQMTLGQIASFATSWSRGCMPDGLQHLVDRCRQEKVFYRYREDASTGIAAFPMPERRKCVIICPGGGYTNVCSLAEGYPLAAAINAMGYAAFIVQYRTYTEATAPNPMDDLAQAVRFLLEHADQLNVDMEDYAVMGFSAGGHLVASFGTETLGYRHYDLPAPKCIILGYPVITMEIRTHGGSREMLLGKDADPEMCRRYSIEKLIDRDYPRTFVWQCEADGTVPIQNTQMLAAALAEKDVEHEYEVFPGDAHGWGLGIGTAAEGWLERAIDFWMK